MAHSGDSLLRASSHARVVDGAEKTRSQAKGGLVFARGVARADASNWRETALCEATKREIEEPMSGFDVHLADARRSRTLIFFGALGGALALIAGLLIFGAGERPAPAMDDGPQIAALDAAPAPSEPGVEAAETSFDAPAAAEPAATPSLSGRALIEAEHAQFAGLWRADIDPVETTVRSGQTFASVLDDAGASRIDAARAIAALEPYFSARELRAGQDLTIFMEQPAAAAFASAEAIGADMPGTRLAGFSFRPDSERTLTVSRVGDQFRTREAVASLEREIVRTRGEVDSSLYLSAIEGGATDRIVVELANILGFAVDFRAIQPGDGFDIVFERFVNRRGETVRTGEILYVVFEGRGDPLEYFRFTAPDGEVGYFTAEGESAQRLLMLMPINGARISSSFGMRFHPVLNTNRPHNGTDFAAPRGTPIMAAGAGIVERANRFGSFGNYIRIRHSNGYETAYAHLNGFARGIRAGARVQQGQTIGYVGTTGRSTGPHLHYEVHLNGRPTNPMALDLPTGRTLTESELELFEAERERIIQIRDQALPAIADAGAVAERSTALASAAASGDAGR
jgi:murein DD-endopeptidase MepM/ murein hydrolase activator NlpD